MTHAPGTVQVVSGRRRLVAALATVAALAGATAGCGVPVDEGARPVADENVPFGLLAPGTGPAPTVPEGTTTSSP